MWLSVRNWKDEIAPETTIQTHDQVIMFIFRHSKFPLIIQHACTAFLALKRPCSASRTVLGGVGVCCAELSKTADPSPLAKTNILQHHHLHHHHLNRFHRQPLHEYASIASNRSLNRTASPTPHERRASRHRSPPAIPRILLATTATIIPHEAEHIRDMTRTSWRRRTKQAAMR